MHQLLQLAEFIIVVGHRHRRTNLLEELGQVVVEMHERVVITRNGRPEAVVMAVSDLAAMEETLELLLTPGALEQIRQAEADIDAGQDIDEVELRRQLAARAQRERRD